MGPHNPTRMWGGGAGSLQATIEIFGGRLLPMARRLALCGYRVNEPRRGSQWNQVVFRMGNRWRALVLGKDRFKL